MALKSLRYLSGLLTAIIDISTCATRLIVTSVWLYEVI